MQRTKSGCNANPGQNRIDALNSEIFNHFRRFLEMTVLPPAPDTVPPAISSAMNSAWCRQYNWFSVQAAIDGLTSALT